MLATPAPSTSVFLTGASSALGREVARRLVEAGHAVTGAVDGYRSALALRQVGAVAAFPGLLRAGELRSAMQGSKVVIHLEPMKLNHVPQINAHLADKIGDIRIGAEAIAQAAADAGVEYLISTSYAFVYGNTGHASADEATEIHDVEVDVINTALAAESAVLHGSVPASVLRAGYVYGAHDDVTTELRDRLMAGRPVLVGNAHGVANWVYVDDLANAILSALALRPQGVILNLVDNTPASPVAFVGYLGDSMALPVQIKSSGGGLMALLKAPPTEPELIDLQTRASNARAAEVLGWKPRFPSYREGLDQTLLVMRAEEPVR